MAAALKLRSESTDPAQLRNSSSGKVFRLSSSEMRRMAARGRSQVQESPGIPAESFHMPAPPSPLPSPSGLKGAEELARPLVVRARLAGRAVMITLSHRSRCLRFLPANT